MTVRELYDALSERISPALSESWDNDGLMCCPDPDRVVSRVLCTLDVTEAAVARALETGADVILSHHPLVFAPLHALTVDEPLSARLISLVRAGVSVFSFHTRFDRLAGGVNDVLARTLRLCDVSVLGEGEASLGRVGTLPCEMSVEAFAEHVKLALGAPGVQVWDSGRPVFRVALVGGEGKDFVFDAVAAGADTYLSGRIGYHRMQDAPINLIEAGHFYTERPAVLALSALVKELLPTAQTEIYTPNPLAFY